MKEPPPSNLNAEFRQRWTENIGNHIDNCKDGKTNFNKLYHLGTS